MASNGMLELGYDYVVLDDCWAYARDPATMQLTWDPSRFPSGMPAVIKRVHDLGFKFGLYTSAGNETCSNGGRTELTVPGSEGYYAEDIKLFEEWEVDYIKLDFCGNVKQPSYAALHGREYHELFGTLVKNSSRDMLLETVAGYWFLRNDVSLYSDFWRFCEDHHDDWESTNEALACRRALINEDLRNPANGYPYMDFLMTGGNGCAPYIPNASGDHCPGQTTNQYRTEYSLWSLTQSPLFVATDVRVMNDAMLALLLNEEVIEIHQTVTAGGGGVMISDDSVHGTQIWGRVIDDTVGYGAKYLVALVNRFGRSPKTVSLSFDEHLDWGSDVDGSVRDLWKSKDLGKVTDTFEVSVDVGDTVLLTITRE
jgi:alpha-galactosidase